MPHTHDGGTEGHDSHGGSRGPGWELLDSIMLACAVVAGFMLGEILWQAWKERRDGVRYDLTPEGAAVTLPDPHPHSGVRVNTDELADPKPTEAPAAEPKKATASKPRPPRNSPGVSAG